MKRKFYILTMVIIVMFMLVGCNEKGIQNNLETPLDDEYVIEEKIKNMTITEKIGQMMLIGVYGYELNDDIIYQLNQYHFGGIILFSRNIKNQEQLKNFTAQLQAKAGNVPLFIAIDEEGGEVSRLNSIFNGIAPSQQAIGNSDNPELAKKWSIATSKILKSEGINLNFAPVADVGSPDTRAFSYNAEETSKFVNEAANGYESEKIIYCLKHFPGIGKRISDPHQEISSIDVSREILENEDLLPFKNIILGHSSNNFMIMISHLKYPALDNQNSATLSYDVITKLLRKELDYEGVVITDDLEMGAIANHNTFKEVGIKAIKAGADILLVCHDYIHEQEVYLGILEAVEKGELTEARIDESVRRILKLKVKNL